MSFLPRLTEKFLLYGGALILAGSVTARKNQRSTTSDWMELERQRGISVSSTVLQLEYKDCVFNILVTPLFPFHRPTLQCVFSTQGEKTNS